MAKKLNERLVIQKLPPGVLYELPYVSAHSHAERRLRKGERQLYCCVCDCWRWADQCTHSDRMTDKEYRAMIRQVKADVKRKYPSAERRYLAELRRARKIR